MANLTILVAFGHGGELDKTQLRRFMVRKSFRKNGIKPIEVEQSESLTVIVARQ